MSTRKIKNAVNNTTGELIYFKGHAQATYMSDGSTVEDAIKNIKPDLSDYVKSEELEGYAKTSDIPSLEGYVKEEDIPSFEGYVQSSELLWTKVINEAGIRLKGTNGTATGNLAISAGDDKTASDGTQFTSIASGDHAVVFGYGNTCAGRTTLAQGLYNTVNGKDSVAFGQRNLVNGDQAFAAGQQNEVTTRLGVTIGYQNKATNTNSIAIGYKNTSGGSGSVALGDSCESSGTSSTAMGYNTKATGAYSSTFGKNTQATNQGEVAMGLYNNSTTSTDASEQTLFSFGIGTSDTNRLNAFEIKKNGNVYIGDELLNEKMSVWDGKQDTLISGTNIKTINGESILGEGDIVIEVNASDLSNYVTRDELSNVAVSGSYDDLTNKPTIPSAVTESTVSDWGFTKNTGTYSKPSTGIPKSDLAGAVQTSLGKADTALQSHQDISGKQDKLVSGTNIKTINGASILGSGDITIEGGSIVNSSNIYVWKNPDWLINGQNQGTITEEVYNAIYNADIVCCVLKDGNVWGSFFDEGGPLNSLSIYFTKLNSFDSLYLRTLYNDRNEEDTLNTVDIIISHIYDDYLYEVSYSRLKIPTKTSQLTNDSGFLVDDIYPDGVYAVTANEELIDYNKADESCIGVALIAGEHKFMITKEDATNDGSNYKLYWRSDSIEGSLEAKYDTVDGTNGYGYLGGTSTPQLDKNFTNWKSGTLSDFNGKANTEFITTLSNNEKDMCVVLNTFNNGTNSQNNYEYNDWYVPACGQLALMYLNLSEINTALTKIGGIEITNDKYQSSTWYPYNYVCYINFNEGAINGGDCGGSLGERRVRFIRDLSFVKSLNERVSDLEEKINNLSSTNGSSEANVKAVDTGDILDDVAVNYATTEYVDSVLGDINSILESIINGGNTPTIITFNIEGTEYQAEEGMTWEEWINSDYNTDNFITGNTTPNIITHHSGLKGIITSPDGFVTSEQVIIDQKSYFFQTLT